MSKSRSHQIRCWVNDSGYQRLKDLSKKTGLELQQVAGIELCGHKIVLNQENKQEEQ